MCDIVPDVSGEMPANVAGFSVTHSGAPGVCEVTEE